MKLGEKISALEGSSVLGSLPRSALESLAEAGELQEHRKNSVVVLESNLDRDLLVVIQGEVEILQKLDGDELEPVTVVGPGEVLGEMALIESKPRSARAIARSAVSLLRIPFELADRMVWGHPPTAKMLARTALDRVRVSAWRRIEKLHTQVAKHGAGPDAAERPPSADPDSSS